jgi:hypothetical protein
VPYQRFAEVNRQLQAERARNEQLLRSLAQPAQGPSLPAPQPGAAQFPQFMPGLQPQFAQTMPQPQVPGFPGATAPRQFQVPGLENLDPDLQATAHATISALTPLLSQQQAMIAQQNAMLSQLVRHSVRNSAQETLHQLAEQYPVFKHAKYAAHAQKRLSEAMTLQELVQPHLRRGVPELASQIQSELEELVGTVEAEITGTVDTTTPPASAGAVAIPGGAAPPMLQTQRPADFRQATAQLKVAVNAQRAAQAGQRQ